jgi:hypothetical protein
MVAASRLAKASSGAIDPETGDQVTRREERGRHPGSQGLGAGERFDQSVFEVQRSVPLRGSWS